MNIPNRSRSTVLFAFLLGSSLPALSQGVEDLWITEVNPSSGQIEVTNVSASTITTPQAMSFCHRFNYRTNIPANTVFESGQSRLFTVSFANSNVSDLWLYRSTRSFGNPNNLLNGLQWGGTGAIGRAEEAVLGDNWDATTSHVAAPTNGQSLLLTGPDPFQASHWSVGEPNLGTFGSEPTPIEVELTFSAGQATITWTGGVPPFAVYASETLAEESFLPVSEPLEERSFSLPIAPSGRQFFQIREADSSEAVEAN